jgi:hypothetical protein
MLSKNHIPVNVQSFSIKTKNQTVNYDNIEYNVLTEGSSPTPAPAPEPEPKPEPTPGNNFSDDFSTNTLSQYTKTGRGTLNYDNANERAHVTTSGNTAFSFSHSVASLEDGTFSIDINTVKKNATLGVIEVRLNQTANTYYKIVNRDGRITGGISKYINGKRVEVKWFKEGYEQGKDYTINVSFSPSSTRVEAFGQTLTIDKNSTPISVKSFTVKTKNQTVNYDNIELQ